MCHHKAPHREWEPHPKNRSLFKDDIVIPVSQSGETADTIAALKLAKEMNAFIYGICNVVGSSISRETHTGIYTHAGPEIGVASTKAFTCQAVNMLTIATEIGYKLKKITNDLFQIKRKSRKEFQKAILNKSFIVKDF